MATRYMYTVQTAPATHRMAIHTLLQAVNDEIGRAHKKNDMESRLAFCYTYAGQAGGMQHVAIIEHPYDDVTYPDRVE